MKLDMGFLMYKHEFVIISGEEKARHCLLKGPLTFCKNGSACKIECHREKK